MGRTNIPLRATVVAGAVLSGSLWSSLAFADDYTFGGKLALTGGVSQVEGSAGGGLTPWAVIGGNGTRDQVGGSAFVTRVNLDDYALNAYGALIGFYDRIELSVAQQQFETGAPGVVVRSVLGAPTAGRLNLQQTVYGIKIRLVGDAVLDQDSWLPQISLGMQHKADDDSTAAIAKSVGAKSGQGNDFYLSATKVFLSQSLLTNLTLRDTRANQLGLLGFGGDKDSSYRLEVEGSVAYLLTPHLALGVEYRSKPDNLGALSGGLKEGNAHDAFLAYAVSKNSTVTLAYVNLGPIVPVATDAVNGHRNQTGAYLSAQYSY